MADDRCAAIGLQSGARASSAQADVAAVGQSVAGPHFNASASSPAPATTLMLVQDAANGASASLANGTSTPPKSAPRARKHDSSPFTETGRASCRERVCQDV